MVNRNSLAVHKEKSKKLMKQQQERQQLNHLQNNDDSKISENDNIGQNECTPFSFGFHFNSLLPQVAVSEDKLQST